MVLRRRRSRGPVPGESIRGENLLTLNLTFHRDEVQGCLKRCRLVVKLLCLTRIKKKRLFNKILLIRSVHRMISGVCTCVLII
jgi:hypothetical protein